MKKSHLDRILGKAEDMGRENLQILIQRLAKERELLETAFNTINDGILIINNKGVIEYCNLSGAEMVKLTEAEIGEATLWQHVPDLAFLAENLRPTTLELEVAYPEKRYLKVNIAELGEEGEQYVVVLTDKTEERDMTEETIESEKLGSIIMLTAGVAHELGNPLNSINIHLQLMERQLGKLEEGNLKQRLTESNTSAALEVKRLDGIIKNFLTAVKPKRLELLDVNLLELLDETLALMAGELENEKVGVEVNLDHNLPVVVGDPNQIKQVFYNLLKNAREAMTAGGKLEIRTESTDDFAILHFKDDGEGISQEELSHVFEPYFSTKVGGHGLGMMVVQRIMREHGGQIFMQSREGSGTTVTLQFPLKQRRIRMLEGG